MPCSCTKNHTVRQVKPVSKAANTATVNKKRLRRVIRKASK